MNDEIDDSWVTPEDKRKLLHRIKELYITKYEWADNVLMKCLLKYHYNEVISAMDKNTYLAEKEEEQNVDEMINNL